MVEQENQNESTLKIGVRIHDQFSKVSKSLMGEHISENTSKYINTSLF